MNKTLRKSLFFILKICVTLLVISPFYIAIIYSVKSKPEMVTNRLAFLKTIHWDNSTRAIETSNCGLAMKNSSLITTVVAVFVITLICTMAAYIIARKNNRFYNTIYYIFVGAMIIPFQSIMTPLYIDMAKWKLLNTLHGFMAKIGFQIAFTVLLVSGFVKSIPKDLEEAAAIDGAGIYQVFFRIVFPLMKPIILTSVVFKYIKCME